MTPAEKDRRALEQRIRRTNRGTRIDLILAVDDAIDTVRPVGCSRERAQLELIDSWLGGAATGGWAYRRLRRILYRVAMFCARRLMR